MGTVYKIHPALGVARVGNHPDAFFVGPEADGSPGVEIAANGEEATVKQYKSDGKIKRQAARFRVFRFLQNDAGDLQLVGEVTSDDAKIEWKVDLCNRKAALDRTPAPSHPAEPRNTDIADRNSLIVRNRTPVTISGKNQTAKEFNGSFLGTPVYLGELRTDGKGRLLVLGGRGKSASVPPGQDLPTFANNDLWHDDVSDGPVTATVTLPGQDPVVVHHPAWVAVAPPDFAPTINSIVTLYDVAFQAAIEKGALKPDAAPSFRRHIKPLIERAAGLSWTNNYARWNDLLSPDWNALADSSDAGKLLRNKVAKRLKSPGLRDFVMPAFMTTYVDQWVAGAFLSDLGAAQSPVPIPEQIDRAALDACVGNNFFPGIEASINLRDKDIYARPFRLDHTNLGKVYPGCLTEIMAVPWQADFMDCSGGEWWPSQRPDIAMTVAARIPGSQANWAEPIGDHQTMVDQFHQLGFVVGVNQGASTVYTEAERDPAFPRGGAMVQ
jgi:hypothetical protein